MKNAKRMMTVLLGGALLVGASGVDAQDWPQWRGPNRDNKVAGFTAPKTWPKSLAQKWTKKVGDGDASPVLVGDKLYVFTREGADEIIRCLDAATGMEVWKDKYPAAAARVPGGEHKGPRSSPAVAEGKVCTLGVEGVLSCLEAQGGKVLWRKESKAAPKFFAASSPLIQDGKCIAYLGKEGRGDLGAFDLTTGEEKWKWAGEGPAYSSPVLLTVDSTKQLVTLTERSLVGINVADGKLLWKTPYKSRYNSETPIVDGPMVYCSGTGGTEAYKVEKKGDGFEVKQVWKKSTAAGMYNTPMLKDGLIYGLASAGGGRTAGTTLFCLKAATGDVAWTDKTPRGQCGGILDAGSVLLLFSSNSELVAFKPSSEKYEEVAKYKIADSPTWAYPIVAGNRIFVKDSDSVKLWTLD